MSVEITEDMLPEGVEFITSGDEVVGFWFAEGRELTDEEQAIVDKAIAERNLPPLA